MKRTHDKTKLFSRPQIVGSFGVKNKHSISLCEVTQTAKLNLKSLAAHAVKQQLYKVAVKEYNDYEKSGQVEKSELFWKEQKYCHIHYFSYYEIIEYAAQFCQAFILSDCQSMHCWTTYKISRPPSLTKIEFEHFKQKAEEEWFKCARKIGTGFDSWPQLTSLKRSSLRAIKKERFTKACIKLLHMHKYSLFYYNGEVIRQQIKVHEIRLLSAWQIELGACMLFDELKRKEILKQGPWKPKQLSPYSHEMPEDYQ